MSHVGVDTRHTNIYIERHEKFHPQIIGIEMCVKHACFGVEINERT